MKIHRWILAIVPLLLWSCRVEQSEPLTPPIGTTTFPRVGGRKIVLFRCKIDLGTGKVELTQPRDPKDDELAAWDSLAKEIAKDGRLYRVTFEDNAGKPELTSLGLPDWVRVSVVELDEQSGAVLRIIPVQDFRGEHERHGNRALVLKAGVLRFWIQFWSDD